jgi:hypothetical protein
MATKAEGVTVLDIPKKAPINVSSPMACLQSMGLMAEVPVGSEEDVQKVIERIKDRDAIAAASVWSHVGGVKIACLTDTVIIHDNGDVEGPSNPEDLQKAPATFCKTRAAKAGLDVIVLLAVNGISRVADVCVYDPRRVAKEEVLYSVAGTIGAWLRVLLGEGWGLRIEVYCDRYSPSEVPEMHRLWVLLMVVLKAYLPHVRMVDTQAAIRVECMAKHTAMRDLLVRVLYNIDKIMSESPFSV